MSLIKGVEIIYYNKTLYSTDSFGEPVYTESSEVIQNVLIAPVSSSDIINNQDLTTASEVYQLAIPKGDNHTWKGHKVKFFGKVYKVVGDATQGIEDMIPLDWNKKVTVARYGRD